jgi:hypothetical protein
VAINPPSDIVLDVINAADPTRAEAATQRLNALGAGAASDDFAKVLDTTAPSSTTGVAAAVGMANARATLLKKDLAASQKTAHAEVEFEATLLNNFVGEMLPKDAPGVYGEGTAGDVWRSMLGDQIAHQIAKSGELGIAKRLFATHGLPHQSGASHASLISPGGAAETAQASGNPLSMPSAADYNYGAFLFPDDKRS